MKDLKAKRKKEKEQEADAKFERLRQRKIRKKMGLAKFYCCPWRRKDYDKMFPKRDKGETHKLSAEELAELRRKAREEAKRLEVSERSERASLDEDEHYSSDESREMATVIMATSTTKLTIILYYIFYSILLTRFICLLFF